MMSTEARRVFIDLAPLMEWSEATYISCFLFLAAVAEVRLYWQSTHLTLLQSECLGVNGQSFLRSHCVSHGIRFAIGGSLCTENLVGSLYRAKC